jgi:hypothetical protein
VRSKKARRGRTSVSGARGSSPTKAIDEDDFDEDEEDETALGGRIISEPSQTLRAIPIDSSL